MRLGYKTLCSTFTIVIRVQFLLSPCPVFSLEIVAPLNEHLCFLSVHLTLSLLGGVVEGFDIVRQIESYGSATADYYSSIGHRANNPIT